MVKEQEGGFGGYQAILRHPLTGLEVYDVKTFNGQATYQFNKYAFLRATGRYEEAIDILQRRGNPAKPGDDFGADDETILSNEFDRPVIVHRYPAALKAFYMETDPERPDLALCMDVLAPEGYGEIIGGGQRIHSHEKLLGRILEHHLSVEAFQWYLDLRRFGSVPHAGFGMGIERAVAWICGLDHVRETIPFPRMLYRLYP